jgi:hypothetical protein
MSIGFDGEPVLWIGANEVSSPKGLVKFNPEGMIGLSLGFQPQEHAPSPHALKGRKIFVIDVWRGEVGSTATFGAGRPSYQYLGLKPQAQSYHPFGISPTVPLSSQQTRSCLQNRLCISCRIQGRVGVRVRNGKREAPSRTYAKPNLKFSSPVRNG